MSTFETLQTQLAQTGRVELSYSAGRGFLRGLLSLNFAAQRGAQVTVTEFGVWAATGQFPAEGLPWSRIRDVHLVGPNLVSSVELTVEGDGTAGRTQVRLPRGLIVEDRDLAVGAQDLAMWLAVELSARGTPL